ncbi:sperm microtubule associated protein 2-like [Watersipora subatra]|uniref:sperm microtubule associated protein 2-like n=1 Tax=Watersipora subatra TaxID=2589382 RepID=UPI00355C6467
MAVAGAEERRIDHLAKHKPIPAGHVNDRRSVYWVDREPLGPPTVMAMTPRLEGLAKHRSLVGEYRFNRERNRYLAREPFYKEIKQTSKNIPEASPRIEALSEHKEAHTHYAYDRDLPMQTSENVPESTERINTLAKSKTELWTKQRKWLNPDQFYDFLPQPVSKAAKTTTATPRVESLAEHKIVSASFQPERPVRWPIEEQALKINATLRVCQLARPRSRTMIRDDGWDPYVVSKAARYAQVTPRLEELSTPLPRKIRSKLAVKA